MNKNIFALISFQSILLLLLFTASCKKEGELGLNILPNSDNIVFHYDTIPVKAYTFTADSSYSTTTSYSLLGSLIDPFFGKANASFLTSIYTTTANFIPEEILSIDSILISIPFSNSYYKEDTTTSTNILYTSIDTSYYGDLNRAFHFKVYELLDTLYMDSVYYSNMDLTPWYNSSLPIYDDMVQFDGTEEVLKLKMPTSYFEKFTTADSTTFESQEAFDNFLKGFYIKCEDQTSQGGAILSLNTNSTSSQMTIYYRTNSLDTLSASFDFYSNKHVNIFEKDYSGTLFENKLNQTNIQDTVTFIQSMDGLATKVMIDENEYSNLNNVVIYDARLEVYLQDTVSTLTNLYEPINSPIILKASNDELDKEYLSEYTGSTGYLGMDRVADLHSFTITKYFQDLIDQNDQENTGLFIYLNSPQNYANRTILRSGNNSKPMQIVVKYSDLPTGK